jgi:hypothetical protein
MAMQAERGGEVAVDCGRQRMGTSMEDEIDPKLQQPLDDEERELMDPDTWDWDSMEEHPPVPNSGVVVAIRFSLEEMTSVGRAADAEGVTLSEYIRQLTLMRALHEVPH